MARDDHGSDGARGRLKAARQRVEAAIARTLGRLPAPVVQRMLARMPVEHGGHRLDPQVQWADLLRKAARHRPIEHGSVARARREYRRMRVLERDPPRVTTQELRMAGDDGAIAARSYRPHTAHGDAALLYFHGGGGVIGDLESHDTICRTFAVRGGMTVVAVDYRLAPEVPYVAAADDALAAMRWLRANAPRLGIASQRIAVGGDSRGGNLAAVLCQQLALHGEPQPALQVLIYPNTDVAGSYASRRAFADGPWLTEPLMQWFERHALGELDRADPRVSPLRADALHGLAPALVTIAGFDPLRDEGLAYAERLREHGVAVQLLREPSLPHGYLQLTGVSKAAAEATDRLIDALRAALSGC
ncbi:MAG: alpha/beta hydrolase [Deltaproteobacteria bacterium]|nr:alpha/beta hydrolase [Deltaproteobacteria bacterium]MBK8714775.1 alpha/beta hydrolase [Deltaproteobacteria bacterium]MBP7289550.1 alpha/beta hydrolase [Nannocystaceae bacterium]